MANGGHVLASLRLREEEDARVSDMLLKILTRQTPLRVALGRKIIKGLSLFSYERRLSMGLIDRPHYGYCIFQAARLASLLGYPKISVIEFGCGGGNGLVNAEMHIAEAMKILPVEIELYGFDNGSGLPSPCDYRDMPHYFRPGLYAMKRESLQQRLKRAKLIIGDVKETCDNFLEKHNPAPIGCMFHDLDFYSSTRDAFGIFDAPSSHFLPRVFMYFDDIIGNDELWACSDFSGERLAIEEFNKTHGLKKISKNYFVRTSVDDKWWPEHVYVYHDFEHPRYNDFVGGEPQKEHEHQIELR